MNCLPWTAAHSYRLITNDHEVNLEGSFLLTLECPELSVVLNSIDNISSTVPFLGSRRL